MAVNEVGQEIVDYSRLAGKTYAFNETHDETRPYQMWFQESDEGIVLFIVFYSQTCRWSRCLGCSLPSAMSLRHIPYRSIMAQVDSVLADEAVICRQESIRKVIVSNNGSVLDQATFSSTALMYFLARLNMRMPGLATLTLETRPEYVDFAELEFIARALAEGDTPRQLELAIGFEVFDDSIRNEVYHKGLKIETFEKLVRDVAPYGYRLKCYFMQKPVPAMTDEQAVADIHHAIDYLGRMAAEHGVTINMHLNPTYVTAGTILEGAFRRGEYVPPTLPDVARAARHARGKPLSIYIALFDEGLAVEGGSFRRPGDETAAAQLDEFNRTQNYDLLDAVC